MENSKAPLTILWGRDGWEKFVALVVFSSSLVAQLVGLLGSGWLRHCYSIAFRNDCPSYHLWDVCGAKGNAGCSGYVVAAIMYCCSIVCTTLIVTALWRYLKGYIRTFKVAQIPSNVVPVLPGALSLCAVTAVWLQTPPIHAQLWWNFFLQLVAACMMCVAVCCMHVV